MNMFSTFTMTYCMNTYGNFILMNTLHIKKETMMAMNPTLSNKIRLSLGTKGLLVWSRITKPSPPSVNRKLEASPSMMYCPFTRYGMKATWNVRMITELHVCDSSEVYSWQDEPVRSRNWDRPSIKEGDFLSVRMCQHSIRTNLEIVLSNFKHDCDIFHTR